MTSTLENLWRDAPDSRDYTAARAAKVAYIAGAYRADLNVGVSAERVAADLMTEAEEQGRINGNLIDGEISGQFTVDGRPVPGPF